MFYAFKSNPGFGFIQVGQEYLYPEGSIPKDSIQITNEQHNDFLTKQVAGLQSCFDIVNGKWVYTEPAPLTTEEQDRMIQSKLIDAVQNFMDKKSQDHGYDNLLSVVTYAEEPANPVFQKDGIAFRAWRSEVWAYCYAQLAAVKAGTRTVPSTTQLISELPALTL